MSHQTQFNLYRHLERRAKRQLGATLLLTFFFLGAAFSPLIRPAQADEPLPVPLSEIPAWVSYDQEFALDVAWGDVDNDGDLDLAIATPDGPKLYLNDKDLLQVEPAWAGLQEIAFSVAWGDADNDGDIDLAVGGEGQSIYLNEQGKLNDSYSWSQAGVRTDSIAWGDLDNNGDFDLVAGTEHGVIIYLNQGLDAAGQLQVKQAWSAKDNYNTESVALGDVDRDGRLDLAVGNSQTYPSNEGQPNQIYRNEGINANGDLGLTPIWSSTERDYTSSLAWGDVDGDGDLDLAVGNRRSQVSADVQPDRVYLNQGLRQDGSLQMEVNSIEKPEATYDIAWNDVDGDGDLDLAAGGWGGNKLYLNQGQDQQGALVMSSRPVSSDKDNTLSLAWGDMDGDGDLDLAVANQENPVKVYLNESSPLGLQPGPTFADGVSVNNMAWGDINNDGYPDVAVSGFEGSSVFLNDKAGGFQDQPVWSASGGESVAWGDMDSDGNLDLAVGTGIGPEVYTNMGGSLEQSPFRLNDGDRTQSVAWGDVDGDGDLDLAVGDMADGDWAGAANKIYRNNDGILEQDPFWRSDESDETLSIAWGDVDSDGDLDLAVGNFSNNRLYLNENGSLQPSAAWSADRGFRTWGVAWGDADGDGNMDLAAGDYETPKKIYLNKNGILQTRAAWISADSDKTNSIAWGDVDGDGDLDLAVGNEEGPSKLYLNEGGSLHRRPAWSSADGEYTSSIAWVDIDNDGDLDLALGNQSITNGNTGQEYRGGGKIYLNRRYIPQQSLAMVINQVGTQQADFAIPITYTLFHPAGVPIRKIEASYSSDGGAHWKPALATGATITSSTCATPSLTTSPYPTSTAANNHVFIWDVLNSGLFGQNDNVVVRLVAYPSLCHAPGTIPNTYEGPYVLAQTTPIRVWGSQVRVVNEDNQGVAGALVYRMPVSQSGQAEAIVSRAGWRFHTDQQGYLAGQGSLAVGDTLVALLPVSSTSVISTKNYTLYYTSAPIETDLSPYTITQLGVQTLTVSAENQLLLFDLAISLEWDASRDKERFISQLQLDLLRTSEILYDWTNGQAALGRVDIYNNREQWSEADVRIYASNRLRPSAVVGGVVRERTPDPQKPELFYFPGQVRMGTVWNRFGDVSGSLGEDWPRALAHELGHYLFFLHDNYLGLDNNNLLVPLEGCFGAMSNPYRDDYSEFHPDVPNAWQKKCQNTLSAQEIGRADWVTINLFYNLKNKPNLGPSGLPLAVTQAVFTATSPASSTVLAAPLFHLQHNGSRVQPGSTARVFLLQEDRLVDLGSPNRDMVWAHGAKPGDRLCLYEPLPAQLRWGCKSIIPGNDQLILRITPQWKPDVIITPVNSRTVTIRIPIGSTGLTQADAGSLYARLYPTNQAAKPAIPLTVDSDNFTGSFEPLDDPALEGYVRVWVESDGDEEQSIITNYTLGGSPMPYIWGGTPVITLTRGLAPAVEGMPYVWGGTPKLPTVSSDGQVNLFDREQPFEEGEFYTLQAATSFPTVAPAWATLVGQPYRLRASEDARDKLAQTSISFQYFESQVPPGEEKWLKIYYLDETKTEWEPLTATLAITYNFISAQAKGEGLYALMSSIEIHLRHINNKGCNLVSYPVPGERPIAEAVASIADYVRVIRTYETNDTEWRVYKPKPDSSGNNLDVMTFGQGYLICVTEPVTWYLKGAAPGELQN